MEDAPPNVFVYARSVDHPAWLFSSLSIRTADSLLLPAFCGLHGFAFPKHLEWPPIGLYYALARTLTLRP